MDDLSAVNSILLHYFPDVLNFIILEYFTSIGHDFQLVETVKCMLESEMPLESYCCDDNYVYVYYENQYLTKNKLVYNKDTTNMIGCTTDMCIYKKNIYVAADGHIYVYNEECKKIYTIEKFDCSQIKIENERIFGSEDYKASVKITNLSGSLLKNLYLQDGDFYNMHICDNHLYILTFKEIIYKYSFDGDLVEQYDNVSNTSMKIDDFFVVDTKIYIKVGFSIFDYDYFDTGCCVHLTRDVNRIHYNNSNLYVYGFHNVYKYNIVRKNIRKLIHKN